jgi:hypothetical protein
MKEKKEHKWHDQFFFVLLFPLLIVFLPCLLMAYLIFTTILYHFPSGLSDNRVADVFCGTSGDSLPLFAGVFAAVLLFSYSQGSAALFTEKQCRVRLDPPEPNKSQK